MTIEQLREKFRNEQCYFNAWGIDITDKVFEWFKPYIGLSNRDWKEEFRIKFNEPCTDAEIEEMISWIEKNLLKGDGQADVASHTGTSGSTNQQCTKDPNTCKVSFCGWPHRCND